MITLGEMAGILGDNAQNYLPPDLAGEKPRAFSLDTRKLSPGDLFVCISGDKFDGHDFAFQAAEKGAIALIAEKDPFNGATPPLAVLRVEDSVAAITALAKAQRAKTRAKVAGITGTAGKTSVKEVLADLLGHYGVVSRNFMNMNNQIGLPISMLNADEQADYWVLEAGISKAGDMDELGALLRPDLAVILNVGPGHTSGLGDKGVAYHKTRFLAHLAEGGQALLNCDYADLMLESQAYARPKSYFSTRRADADFYAVYEGPASAASGSFALKLQGRDLQVSAPFRGVFGAENVAAIAGAASLLGLSPNQIRDGIGETALPAQRFNVSFYKNTVLIDDSYNSNPLSASRMLESAAEMAREKKLPLFLVMGEMGEQDQSELVHRDLGREMAESRAAAIFWKGGQADAVREGLERNEFEGKFTLVADAESFRAAVAEVYPGNGVFLFKGSRSNRLEELVKVFVADYWTDYAE